MVALVLLLVPRPVAAQGESAWIVVHPSGAAFGRALTAELAAMRVPHTVTRSRQPLRSLTAPPASKIAVLCSATVEVYEFDGEVWQRRGVRVVPNDARDSYAVVVSEEVRAALLPYRLAEAENASTTANTNGTASTNANGTASTNANGTAGTNATTNANANGTASTNATTNTNTNGTASTNANVNAPSSDPTTGSDATGQEVADNGAPIEAAQREAPSPPTARETTALDDPAPSTDDSARDTESTNALDSPLNLPERDLGDLELDNPSSPQPQTPPRFFLLATGAVHFDAATSALIGLAFGARFGALHLGLRFSLSPLGSTFGDPRFLSRVRALSLLAVLDYERDLASSDNSSLRFFFGGRAGWRRLTVAGELSPDGFVNAQEIIHALEGRVASGLRARSGVFIIELSGHVALTSRPVDLVMSGAMIQAARVISAGLTLGAGVSF